MGGVRVEFSKGRHGTRDDRRKGLVMGYDEGLVLGTQRLSESETWNRS